MKANDRSIPGQHLGRVEFDDRGTAVWRPRADARSEDSVRALLHVDGLSIAEEGDHASPRHLRPIEAGFDPYHSGLVVRSEPRRRPADLRALSEKIKAERGSR